METKLLSAALYKRAAFEEINKYSTKEYLSDQARVIWDVIHDYYELDTTAKSVDKDILMQTIERLHPKHSTLLNGIVTSLTDVSTPNVLHEVLEQRKEAVKLQLASAFASTKTPSTAIDSLLEEYNQLTSTGLVVSDTSHVVIAPNISDMMASRSSDNRIPVYPQELTDQLGGGCLRGHHIVVFAPTDMGKTLFAINAMRGWLENKYKVLYIGNEDPITDIIERFLISLTGRSKAAIKRSPDKAQEFAESRGWHNIVFAELAPGTIGEIRALVEEHEPDVLVVDQIRNLDTGDKSNYVRSLEKAAQAMRNFGKKYNLLSVSLTQAGDSATGKVILGRGDIDNSNVGIPGTADLMIGIGATSEQEFDGVRTLSFPKQKVSGVKTPITVTFNERNMRVE